MSSYCEDYPACGHKQDDCSRHGSDDLFERELLRMSSDDYDSYYDYDQSYGLVNQAPAIAGAQSCKNELPLY